MPPTPPYEQELSSSPDDVDVFSCLLDRAAQLGKQISQRVQHIVDIEARVAPGDVEPGRVGSVQDEGVGPRCVAGEAEEAVGASDVEQLEPVAPLLATGQHAVRSDDEFFPLVSGAAPQPGSTERHDVGMSSCPVTAAVMNDWRY